MIIFLLKIFINIRVDRSNNLKILVSCDDWGKVNLFRNPCLAGNKGTVYWGHSSVTICL